MNTETDLLAALHASLTRPCRNELCDYRLVGGAAYCCDGCARADEQGYEVHESGLLGHSPSCARRAAEEPQR